MNKSIFKAYDIRGRYPDEINEKVVFKISKHLPKILGGKIVVGYDARLSSPALYKAVLRGLNYSNVLENIRIVSAEMITTPMLYFLVNKLKADGGIMVTASHNPKEYNGLKVVGKNAVPISGKEIFNLLSAELSMRTAVLALQRREPATPRPDGGRYSSADRARRGSVVSLRQLGREHYGELYTDFLKKFLKPKRKLRVVFDCSNGTTGLVLKILLNAKRYTLNAVLLNAKLDGNFSAHGPNPMAKDAMRQVEKEVKRQKADLGIIFDGDGDRVFFVDNRGRLIDANEIGYILMQMFKPPYVVGEVSSWRLKNCKAQSAKRKVYVSRVGHYFFKKLMREKKALLGLEHSGHYYFKDFFYCDAGIFAAIQVINFISGLKTDLANWLDKLPKYYRSGEINFKVSNKEKILKKIEKRYKKQAIKISKLDGLTMEFPDYWFNLRPSNTEDLLRLNMEATSKKVLAKKLREIKKYLQ